MGFPLRQRELVFNIPFLFFMDSSSPRGNKRLVSVWRMRARESVRTALSQIYSAPLQWYVVPELGVTYSSRSSVNPFTSRYATTSTSLSFRALFASGALQTQSRSRKMLSMLPQALANGILTGGLMPTAIGLTLTFGVMRFVNLFHGEPR